MKQAYYKTALAATLIFLTTFLSVNVSAAQDIQLNNPAFVEKSYSQAGSTDVSGYAWLPLGDGTNGWVNSLTTDDSGNLYAGGYFTQAGGLNAQVAKWDGSGWSAVGSRVNEYDVYALTIDNNGNLYAALFSNAGGQLSSLLRKWDGNTWLTLGETYAGIIWDLVVDKDGNLYASGEFTQIGGVSANNIAKWDGITWSALGDGTNGSIQALTIDTNGILYAGGYFSQAGDKSVDNIAEWDGIEWHSLGAEPELGGVYDLVTDSDGDLYAAYYSGISVWDGTTWNTLASSSSPQSLAIDENGFLYASFYEITVDGGGPGSGSYDGVRKWTGDAWLQLSLIYGSVVTINYDYHQLFVGGGFGSIGGVDAYNIAMLIPIIFSDVPIDYWAKSYIERLYYADVTGGCTTSPLNYCPEASVTRAQMAVFLEKGRHYPFSFSPPNVTPTFTDTVDHWTEDWIEALKNDGITSGCGTGLYCPEAPVTRAQMAVFLLRAKYGSTYNPPAVGASTGFGDVPTDHWAAAWIKQLVAEGITSGCGSGNYCPDAPVTRAQMAVFLVKTFNLP